jgi:hypothetical protein
MATFDDYVNELRKGVKKLAQELVEGLEADALSDMNAFLKKSERDLQRWTTLLAAGEITKQDFTDLVQAKKALTELHELTRAGVAAAKLDRFRTDLISLVVDTAMKVYL